MTKTLYRVGRFAAHRPWRVILIWFVLAVGVVASSATFGRELEDSFEAPGLDSSKALDLLTSAQSVSAGPTAQVVLTPRNDADSLFDMSSAMEDIRSLETGLRKLPNVVGVSDAAQALNLSPELAAASGSVSPDGRVGVIRVQYALLEKLSVKDLENLKAWAAKIGPGSPFHVEMNGDLFFSFESDGSGSGEMIGLIAAVIILLLAFGSLLAMGLPIGLAVFGLALGVSSMSLINYLVEIPSWAPQIASMVGLGVGIDYALFLVTRHREFLARGMSVEEAAGRSNATAGQAVIFAGGTVVIAILGLAVAGIPFMTSAGIAISVTVLLMVMASITLLPAFLGLAGHRINGIRRTGRRRTQMADGPVAAVSARWERWGSHVARNAWTYAVSVTLFLLAVTAPVLSLQLGFPDEGSLPKSSTERRAYDLVAEGFGPGVNGPLVVAVDISKDASVVEPLRSAITTDVGVAGVAPADVNTAAGVATLIVFPRSAPQDDATIETINRLRADVFPEVLAGTSATAHIGGQTATFSDLGDRVTQRLPYFIAAVVVLSFLLLILVFRSVVVPLKAAIMNLLSIGSAYGVLVMVFQWGWGKSLIGLESTIPVVAFIPMFMFAILFGLSMDYEVFLLSRVREEYLVTGDNDASAPAPD